MAIKNGLRKLSSSPLNRGWRKNAFIVAMLVVPLTHFLIFWLIINLNSILLAFQSRDALGNITWGFQNFEILIRWLKNDDPIMVQAIKNTLKYFSVNLFITIPLSLLISYFIYKKIFMYKVYRYIFFLPSIISAVVLSTLYKYIIAPGAPGMPGGPIAELYELITGIDVPLFLQESATATNAIIIFVVLTGFGGNLVLFNGAMARIPEEVTDAAKLDGITMVREIFQIVIPFIWPTISTVITLATVGIFTASGPILLFTNGAFDTWTISFWIFYQVNNGASPEFPSAIGLFFTAIALPIVFVVRWVMNKLDANLEY